MSKVPVCVDRRCQQRPDKEDVYDNLRVRMNKEAKEDLQAV